MRPAPHKSYTRQQGLSLIEVMIALVIGIILLSGAVSIFISNNAAANLGAQLSRMQDNGRLLIDILSRDIRMAGYSGCTSRGNAAPSRIANSPPLLPFSDDGSVRGYYYNGNSWAPALPTELTRVFDSVSAQHGITVRKRERANILVVQHADECVGHVAETTTANTITAYFPPACNFPKNSTDPLPLMISKCDVTEVFQSARITDAGNNERVIEYDTIRNSARLSGTYTTKAIVSVPLLSIFYVGEKPNSDGPELSLYMLRWEPDADTIHEGVKVGNPPDGDYRNYKLADGVEEMQILYGRSASNELYADTYGIADSMTETDWSQIRSVRISLGLRSTPLTFTTSTTPPNDERLRFSFSTTVSLRNRLP